MSDISKPVLPQKGFKRKPRPTFPVEKSTFSLIASIIKNTDPNGPGGSFNQVLKAQGEEQAVIMFVETLLARIYNFYQPMDIVQRAMKNRELTKTGEKIAGFLAVEWKMTPDIYNYLDRKFKGIGPWHQQLDLLIKKLLFQVDKGIEVMTERQF